MSSIVPLTELVFYVPSENGLPDRLESFPFRLEHVLAAPPVISTEGGRPSILFIFNLPGVDPINMDFETFEERDAWIAAICSKHRIERVWSDTIAYRIVYTDDLGDQVVEIPRTCKTSEILVDIPEEE